MATPGARKDPRVRRARHRAGAPAVIVEAVDEHTCYANVGSDNAHQLALWLGLIDSDFEAGTDRDLAREVGHLADRYTRATR